MNQFNAEHFYYSTKIYDTAIEAWKDLEDYLKQNADGYCLFMRTSPEVNEEYLFDEKKKIYRGFVRFSRWGKQIDGNTITIPSLGSV